MSPSVLVYICYSQYAAYVLNTQYSSAHPVVVRRFQLACQCFSVVLLFLDSGSASCCFWRATFRIFGRRDSLLFL